MMCGPTESALHQSGAISRWIGRIMDIVLHIGAHRCATTSFQTYLETNAAPLAAAGIATWTPRDTRNGLFDALGSADMARAGRAKGRIALRRKVLTRAGLQTLLISEENMIGATRANLRGKRLYPDILARLGRIRITLGPVRRIGIALRSYDSYWASALAFAVLRGHKLPDGATLDALADHPRGWDDVAADVTRVFPEAELRLWRFEDYAHLPHQQLRLICAGAPHRGAMLHLEGAQNPSPSRNALRDALSARGRFNSPIAPGIGRWEPFSQAQIDRMRNRYTADLDQLRKTYGPNLATPAATRQLHHDNARIAADKGATDANRPLTGENYGTQKRLV